MSCFHAIPGYSCIWWGFQDVKMVCMQIEYSSVTSVVVSFVTDVFVTDVFVITAVFDAAVVVVLSV